MIPLLEIPLFIEEAVKSVFSMVASVFSYFRDRQLINAGRAEERASNDEAALEAIRKAKAARDALKSDPASILSDPDNRDR